MLLLAGAALVLFVLRGSSGPVVAVPAAPAEGTSTSPPTAPTTAGGRGLLAVDPSLLASGVVGSSDPVAARAVGTVTPTLAAELAAASGRIASDEGRDPSIPPLPPSDVVMAMYVEPLATPRKGILNPVKGRA